MLDILMRLLRVATYIWVASEAAFLAILYYTGYKNYKASPIIKSLQRLFIIVAALFIILAFAPIITPTHEASRGFFTIAIPVVSLFLGQQLNNFKNRSMDEAPKEKVPPKK